MLARMSIRKSLHIAFQKFERNVLSLSEMIPFGIP